MERNTPHYAPWRFDLRQMGVPFLSGIAGEKPSPRRGEGRPVRIRAFREQYDLYCPRLLFFDQFILVLRLLNMVQYVRKYQEYMKMASRQYTHIRPPSAAQYKQGLANLALEGLSLSDKQDQLVRDYHAGRITKDVFLRKVTDNARSG